EEHRPRVARQRYRRERLVRDGHLVDLDDVLHRAPYRRGSTITRQIRHATRVREVDQREGHARPRWILVTLPAILGEDLLDRTRKGLSLLRRIVGRASGRSGNN